MPNPTNSLDRSHQLDLLFKFAFWLFVGSITFSAIGLLLLKLAPVLTMQYFGTIFIKLVKTPTWTFMTLLPILSLLMYGPSLGKWRMGFFFFWGCLIGGLSEWIGTTGVLDVGGLALPFGAYEYTGLLGAKFDGHVPYFIPPSWFAMSIVSLDLARRLNVGRWGRILAGTLFMVLWDVSLDPAMTSGQFQFWSYEAGGFFYGMPFSNWIGWFGVTLIIIIGYEYIGKGLVENHDWAPWVYILNCLFPLILSFFSGLYGAVVVGILATAVPFIAIWARRRAADEPSLAPAQA